MSDGPAADVSHEGDASTRIVPETVFDAPEEDGASVHPHYRGGGGAAEEEAPTSHFKLSQEQERVQNLVIQGASVFFSGSAGVGKVRTP